MNENIVAKEVAEQEFSRFVKSMALDLDEEFMDAEDRTAFEKQKRRIVNAISDGSLIIDDGGQAIFTPQNPKSKHKDAIVFRERSGASVMAMDGKKKGHDVAKSYAIMADITGLHPSTFAQLVGLDIKICEALFALLMD